MKKANKDCSVNNDRVETKRHVLHPKKKGDLRKILKEKL